MSYTCTHRFYVTIQGVPKVVHQPENTFIVTDAQIEHHFRKYHTVLSAKSCFEHSVEYPVGCCDTQL